MRNYLKIDGIDPAQGAAARAASSKKKITGGSWHIKAASERDQLAAELGREYPVLAARLAELLGRVDENENDQLIKRNARLPMSAKRLEGAELVARGLRGFLHGTANIRLTRQLRPASLPV
jgi:hypothetical protein